MSKQTSAAIVKIEFPEYRNPTHPHYGTPTRVYHVFYSTGRVEHIHAHTQPRRFEAVKRCIGGRVWNQVETTLGGIQRLTPKTVVPSLAESFADAAISGLKELDPSSVSLFESEAAHEERIALQGFTILDSMTRLKTQRNAARRAITYRFYARTLISGRADRAALVAALQGIE